MSSFSRARSLEPSTSLEHSGAALSFSDLVALRDGAEKTIDGRAQGRIKIEEEMVGDFIRQLLAEQIRFERIFNTASGSTYFVAADGASLRFTHGSQGIRKIQPVMQKQVVVGAETAQELLEAAARGAIVGHTITKAAYETGAVPCEFGTQWGPEVPYEETLDSLTINAPTIRDSIAYHIGHAIVEII